MARRRGLTPTDFKAVEISRDALLQEPKSTTLSPNTTEYNFKSSQEFTRFIYSQKDTINDKSQRVVVYAHDSETNLLVKVFANEQSPKTPGVTIGRLKEIIANGASSGIRKYAPIKMGRIDFFKVRVYSPKSDGSYDTF